MNRLVRNASLFVCLAVLPACSATDKSVTRPPEYYFKEAEDLNARGRYEDAIAQWKKVKESYRSPELTAIAELKIADAYFDNRNYIEAAAAYEDFRKLHPTNPQTPYALYRTALSFYNQIEGIDTDQTPVKNASAFFDSFIKIYPQSEYIPDAKARLADCRLKMAQYELYVGRFYYRTDKYVSSIGRLEGLIKNFPDNAAREEALFYLGASYLKVGEKAKGKETFNRLMKEFPSSRFIDDARKVLDKEY